MPLSRNFRIMAATAGAIILLSSFKTTGFMASGLAALAMFRFDKSFATLSRHVRNMVATACAMI